MLSLVNYGNSDSENEISDEDDEVALKTAPQIVINQAQDNDEELLFSTSKLELPKPQTHKPIVVEEEEDEFLHKKEVPIIAPPKKKEKVKITIPKLTDFKEDEDEDKIQKIQPINKKSGLLDRLQRLRPTNTTTLKLSKMSALPRPPSVTQTTAKSTETSADQPKKVGLIPYALMSHKPKTSEAKKPNKKDESDEDDDEEQTGSFFSFASKDDDLPAVSEEEVQALVAKETARMEQRKRQNDEDELTSQYESYKAEVLAQQQQDQIIDEAAMKALLGGNRAKRSKIDNIQIIDLNATEVLPNRDEWLRKTLAGETSYVPTGHIVDKVRITKIALHNFL